MKKKKILKALRIAEAFLEGFENDDTKEGIPKMQRLISEAIMELENQKETKILITIEGGICQGVMSTNTKDIRVVVVDYDKNGDEPVIVTEQIPEKLKTENFYELFTDKSDPVEMQVHDEMKQAKF